MELSKYEQELKDRSEKIVEELTSLVNSMSFKPDYFIEKMSRDHRTLQQSFTKLCLQWLEYVASEEYQTDGRNIASHDLCKLLIELYGTFKSIPGSGTDSDFTADSFKYYGTPSRMLPLI